MSVRAGHPAADGSGQPPTAMWPGHLPPPTARSGPRPAPRAHRLHRSAPRRPSRHLPPSSTSPAAAPPRTGKRHRTGPATDRAGERHRPGTVPGRASPPGLSGHLRLRRPPSFPASSPASPSPAGQPPLQRTSKSVRPDLDPDPKTRLTFASNPRYFAPIHRVVTPHP